MGDAHYETPLLAELYDLDSPWSVDRDFYLALAGQKSISILDIGCGTGLLCDAYAAKGHTVTGVDPAQAMLDVARAKPHGGQVEWVRSTAQDYRSAKRFDLIIMTGNALQVFLNEVELAGALHTMALHLAPGGQVAFETRNPALDWSGLWDYAMTFALNGIAVTETRHFIGSEGGIVQHELRYRFPDKEMVSRSTIRFWRRDQIETLAEAAGFVVNSVLGDWNGEPFDEKRSQEMVFLLRAPSPSGED